MDTGREIELIDKLSGILSHLLWKVDRENKDCERSLESMLLSCKNMEKSNSSDVKSFAKTLHRDITQFKKKL